MVMKIFSAIILIIAILVLPVVSQNPNLGTAGAQFLKIPVGAQAAGMGGAFVAYTDDALGVFWNPAAITNVRSNSALFSHIQWFEMFDVNAVSYVHNFENLGTFGIGIMVLSMDEMEVTTEASPNGTGRFFDAQDFAVSVSYARLLTNNFSAGLNIKFIHQSIWNETASGIAFDVGTQYRIDFQNLVIAMSMLNFGPDMKLEGPDLSVKYDANQFLNNRLLPTNLETEAYPLPLSFQIGLAFDLYNERFFKARTSIDAVHPNDNDERIHFGLELAFFEILYLRGGYKFKHDDEAYNFGFGLRSFLGEFLLKVDYAYSVYNILPDVHFITLGFDF